MLLLREIDRPLQVTEVDPAFWYDVRRGLSAKTRSIPARWLYDRSGSELFEAITALPEYYQTRTERAILSIAAAEVASVAGDGRVIVEFGAGSASKTPILLSALKPSAYVPIDISVDFLWESVARLSESFPALDIYPVEGDFTCELNLPRAVHGAPRLGFFPGSTIGNLLVPEAVDLLRKIAATLGEGSMLLIGIDRANDPDVLIPAYDDAQGITAAFNLNLLHRINRELGGSVPVDGFRHLARWNDSQSRMEMHLQAVRNARFTVLDRSFEIEKGETIHTENSLKYGLREANVLLRGGGWTPIADWTDADRLFSLILAKREMRTSTP
jgi:L-histidine N-alpha-methyltransferase